MESSRSTINQTPIKKWQLMSAMEDELAIVESDHSEVEQSELFHSLVGQSPHNYSHISLQSPEVCSSEEDEVEHFSGFNQEESME